MIDYAKIQEVADFLGKNQDSKKLGELADIVTSGDVYLTFWGQFSAGKSKLINSIVGRDILPVKRTETTAVLTYIRFGEEERCRIRYSDGHSEDKDLSYALTITQQTQESDVSHIDYLELTVNEPMISNNLVMVDTPGINTLHQRHQQLAEDAVSQSGKLVYVLGGAPSKIDKEAIEAIVNDGIDIIFVRTHCDAFNETEENVTESLQKEQNTLENLVGDKIEIFLVSNVKESIWFEKINLLRQKISQIGLNLEQERQNAISMRCEAIAKRYVSELEAMSKRINELLDGNNIKLQQEINETQEKVDKLSKSADLRENNLRSQIKEIEDEVRNELKVVCERSKQKFTQILKNVPDSQEIVPDIPIIFEKNFKKTIMMMQQVMTEKLDIIVTSAYDDIYDNVHEVNRTEPPRFEDIQHENTILIEQCRAKLIAVKKELENIDKEKGNIGFDIQELKNKKDVDYDELLRQLNDALEKIPKDTPLREIEDDSTKMSEVFKKIGQAADLALLLVPGEQIAAALKGAVNVTKVAQGLGKMGKVGEVILQAGNVVAKNASKIDQGRDLLYSAGNIFGFRNRRKMAANLVDKVAGAAGDAFDKMKDKKKAGEPGFFDYISAEYWFGKFGGLFDEPPKWEVDREEEDRRNQLRHEISEKKQRLVEEKIEKMRQVGLLKTKEKELAIRKQEQENLTIEIEKELKNRMQDMREEATRESISLYKKRYVEYYSNTVESVSQKFSQIYLERAKNDIDLYVEREKLTLMKALSEKKEQLDNLMKAKVNGEEKLKEQLSICKKHIDILQEVL